MSGQRLFPTQRGSTAWLRHHIVNDRVWRLIDAKDQVLGRLSVQISRILQGKHKPTYLDNVFCGDPIVVINAKDIALTGRKQKNKLYIHHSGYPGGLKKIPIEQVRERRPHDILRLAVRGMLPKNRLRAVMMDNLHIYMDDEHKHEAQKPVLTGPAHCGKRIGHGGPPTKEELSQWWLDNITDFDDETMQEVVAEVRGEAEERNTLVGLAQVLAFDDADNQKANDVAARAKYITAADRSLKGPAVIVPGVTG